MKIDQFQDRVVQYPGRVKLIPVSGELDTYDTQRTEGDIYSEGTLINAEKLNPIVDRINGSTENVGSNTSRIRDINQSIALLNLNLLTQNIDVTPNVSMFGLDNEEEVSFNIVKDTTKTKLNANANAGSNILNVVDIGDLSKYKEITIQSNSNKESHVISSVSGNIITLETNLVYSYVTGDSVYRSLQTVGYDTENFSYDNVFYQETLNGIDPVVAFSEDGLKMFLAVRAPNTVYQFTLTEPWNVTPSNVSYDNVSYSIAESTYTINSLVFSSDGKRMFVLISGSGTSDRVYEYKLANAWNMSGGVTYTGNSVNVGAQDEHSYEIRFSPDGKKLFYLGGDQDTINQYSLLSPWTFANGTTFDGAQDITSIAPNPWCMEFSKNGKSLFILDAGDKKIIELSLENAFDVIESPALNTFRSYVLPVTSFPNTIVFNKNGTKMFISDAGTNVYQFTIGEEIPFLEYDERYNIITGGRSIDAINESVVYANPADYTIAQEVSIVADDTNEAYATMLEDTDKQSTVDNVRTSLFLGTATTANSNVVLKRTITKNNADDEPNIIREYGGIG